MLASTSRLESPDPLQRRIVSVLQDGLPVTRHPYREIAAQLEISEQQLQKEMQSMLDSGAIRRIGVVPNHYALGYRFNLMVVWDIEDNEVDAIGERIGAMEFVSHCYRRPRFPDWPYNLFVMVHGKTRAEVEDKIERVREQTGAAYRSHTALNSTKILKKTGLRIRSEEK
ncbi:MAG: hypothetical protein V7754_20295 [Halioglobus sp.]